MDGRNIKITMILPGRIRTNISLHALNEQGSEHGVMDPGQIQGMPADICARKVLRGIKKQKREILVGGKELLMVYIRKCFPFLFYPLARKAGER